MSTQDFKYVIQTDLKLTAGAVSNLLKEIKLVDNLISRQNIGNISLNARINRASIVALQKEIGLMKFDISLRAKLDKTSISNFKREIAVLAEGAKKNVEVGLTANETASTSRTVTQSPIATARRRIGADLNNISDSDIKRRNLLALADQRAAKAASLHADANLKGVKSLNVRNQAAERALRIDILRAKVDDQLARTRLSQTRSLDLESRITERQSRVLARDSKRLGSVQTPSAQNQTAVQKLENSLKDPTVQIGRKIEAMNKLKEQYSAHAKQYGMNFQRSFEVFDPAIGKLRTTTYEFTEMGRVVDKGSRSIQTMFGNVARNTTVYTAMTAGFAAVTASIFGAVNSMAQFESQFLKIQNITNQRNADTANGSPKPFSDNAKDSRKDIFDLGQRYGLNPIQDVMPIYTDIIRRSDIAKSADEAKRLTQLVVRAGVATGGNDVQGDDLQRLGADFTSIYSQMFDVWSPSGKGELAIRKMSNFVDVLAKMSSSGANIDKSMDAIADLVPYVTGDGNMDLNFLASIVSTAQHTMGDASGSEISSVLKMMFTNLVKADGSGSIEARRILGTSVNNSLQEQINALSVRMNPESEQVKSGEVTLLTKGEIGELARNLASSGGANGGARNAQFSKILNTLPDAYALYQSSLDSQGKAEEMAIKNSQTLRGEWQKLVATMQELSVNLGDSGILHGLKSMVKVLNEVAGAVSSVLSVVNKLGGVMPSIFGKEMGQDVNGIIGNVLMAGSLIGGGRFAYNKFLKKPSAPDINSILPLDRLRRSTPSAFGVPRGNIIPMNANGGYGNVRQLNQPQPRTTGVGNTIGNIANAAWLFTTFRKGPDITKKSAQTTVNILEKFGATLKNLGGPLLRFGMLLTRLSVIGAVLGGAFLAGKAIYKHIDKGKDKEAGLFVNSVSTASGRDEVLSITRGLGDLINKGNPFADGANANSYRVERQRELRDVGVFGSSITSDEALLADGAKFKEYERLLKERGMELDYRQGGKAVAGNIDFMAGDPIEGKRRDYSISLFDKKSNEDFSTLTEALLKGTGVLSLEWEKANAEALNYSNTISAITGIQERLSKVTTAQNIASALNSTNFIGAENSSSYISNELTNVKRSMEMMDESYRELSNQRNMIRSSANANANSLTIASATLMGFDKGGEKVSAIDSAFNSAKDAGSASNFANQYESLQATEEGRAQFAYAKAISNSYLEQQSLEGANKSIDEITNSMTQQVSTLKQLEIAYALAASGMAVFEGAIKKTQSSISTAQTAFNMADGYEEQRSTMSNLLNNMTLEAKLYTEQVSSLQADINNMISSNPDQDFSVGALYNPSEGGLSIQQATVKQNMDNMYSAMSNQNSSYEALRQQVDAMKELVLTSDKYRDMWDSVNERINLSKELAGQLTGLLSDRNNFNYSANLSQLTGGKGFNRSEMAGEEATSRRDSFADISKQINKSLITYGNDATKLKEALGEIDGTTDKLETAFLQPLKSIVDVDMGGAAKTQLEAASVMSGNMDILSDILNGHLDALNNVVDKINGKETAINDSTHSGLLSTTPPKGASKIDALGINIPYSTLPTPEEFLKKSFNLSGVSGGNAYVPASRANQYDYEEIKATPSYSAGNMGVSGVSAAALANKNLKVQTSVTENELNAWINSKIGNRSSVMKNTGGSFIKAAGETGLDPVYLAAHAAHETGWGTSDISKDKNNFFGIGAYDSDPYNGARKYGSIDEGISQGASFIANNYANGKYGQDTLNKMRFNKNADGVEVHQYATDEGWASKIANIMTGFGRNAVTGNESTVIPTASGLPSGIIGDNKELTDLQKALEDLAKSSRESAMSLFTEQRSVLLGQGDSIQTNFTSGLSDFVSKMGINGQGRFDLGSFNTDSIKDTRLQLQDAISNNNSFVDSIPSFLESLRSSMNDSSLNEAQRVKAGAEYEAVSSMLSDGEYIKSINANTKQLEVLASAYALQAYKDPTKNAAVAAEEMAKQQQLITNIRSKGNPQYYEALAGSNQMHSNYMTTERKTGIVQEHFDNTGDEYGQLAKLEQIGFQESVGLIFKQMTAVAKVLTGLAEGTNAWHIALEDAVSLQEQIVELENKKTETAKRYFELTSNGVNAYVNSRAFTQNRDVRRANDNQRAMTSNYDDNYRNNPKTSYTEGLVALQAISDAYDTVQRQIDDYRNGVVGAFKAGVLSLSEYIKKMNELRDVQAESNEQALNMKGSIESTFQSSLSGALQSGFEGGFDAQGDFLKSVKSGIGGTIASQMSTAVLSQSGLMDSVNNVISKLVTQMTTGNPNDAVNLFNNMDVADLLDSELAKFLPLIQQITDSTQGMFNIMKDEVFNAPNGFKIDNALYEMQKPLKYEDVMSKIPARDTNEAGAPNVNPDSRPSNPIVLPPTGTPIGGGIGQIIGEIVRPIESVGSGSVATPFNTKMVNPVEEILKGLVSFKGLYGGGSVGSSGTNMVLNAEADKLRETLKILAPDIAAEIGDGKTGMSLEKMTQYLASQDLSAYETALGINGVTGGIGALMDMTGIKFDSLIGGISGVISAVVASKASGSSSSTGSSSGVVTPVNGSSSSTPSPKIPVTTTLPPSGISTPTTPVNNVGIGNNGVGSSKDINNNIAKLQADKAFREAEKIRTQQVIANRRAQGLDTSTQEKYLRSLDSYHTGGIAGIMNFANPNKLNSDEIFAILKKGEPVLQGGQISSLADHFQSRSSGGGGALEINININGNASGVDSDTIKQAVRDGVSQGLREMSRQQRLSNLSNKGVSYN